MNNPCVICKIKDKKEITFQSCVFEIINCQEYIVYEFGTHLIRAVVKKEFIEYIYMLIE